ncbi:hypothetical protein M9H77_12436 [Catharanthus roseus]|uniref:Uncharacterized protein n=1 Tax=Catharanthus roseus TaxID=4058 RepID=A0ACC0BHK0_CATRO|nr:hypothetical protein M9H77_12436 [Catharanthus roseus]
MLFRLLVVADYLDINGLLSLSCEVVFYMIKRKDPDNIHRILNITLDFSPEEEEKMLTRTSHVIIPNVSDDILAKIVNYYKRVVTQPPFGENNIELKAFVLELVKDDEETQFGLLVTADYLDIKGLLSLACENILDMIKHKDPVHIHRIFNIRSEFTPEEEERM